jgi:hypothetical protein
MPIAVCAGFQPGQLYCELCLRASHRVHVHRWKRGCESRPCRADVRCADCQAALVLCCQLRQGQVLTKRKKLSLKGQPAGFSGLTTGLLHWLTGPYVHALEYLPRTQQLDVHTLSLLCRPVHTRVHLAEVRLTTTPSLCVSYGSRMHLSLSFSCCQLNPRIDAPGRGARCDAASSLPVSLYILLRSAASMCARTRFSCTIGVKLMLCNPSSAPWRAGGLPCGYAAATGYFPGAARSLPLGQD